MTDPREIDFTPGADPLDSRMGLGARARPPSRPSWWLSNRLALGLPLTPLPSLLLVIGFAAGPEALGLLSRSVLSYLDPVVSVALVALGILIGFGLDLHRQREGQLLGAASAEASLTLVLVTAGIMFVGGELSLSGTSLWLVALVCGTCAAVSSTAPWTDVSGAIVTRIGDLDDVLPVVMSGVIVALTHESSTPAALWLATHGIGITLAVAIAGWLLVSQSASDVEQRVFAVGTVVLLGGIAEFLMTSALLAGLVTGLVWNAVGGTARDRFARSVRYMQHPLLVLLLLIAGARVGFSPALAPLVLVYVVARVAGKLLGGWGAARLTGPNAPRQLGLHLMSPGIIAVAIALNVVQAAGDRAAIILAIAVVGSVASELFSLLVRPSEGAR